MNKLLLPLMVLVLAWSCTSRPEEVPDFVNYHWAMDTLWDDGLAEVAIYDAERVVYGKPRRFEYVHVLVKEDFNREFQVKTDDYSRNDLYAVMKVNQFCRIETLAYPYHYLTSIFYERGQPYQVHKLTNTSQEWCGNTAKSFTANGNTYTFDYLSYWDGQGNGTAKVQKGPWFEDQLSYSLRTYRFRDGIKFTVPLYPTQVTSRAEIPTSQPATIQVTSAAPAELAALDSSFLSDPVWKVEVQKADGSAIWYWFSGVYPNALLQMEATDGRRLTLKSLKRDAYWAHE